MVKLPKPHYPQTDRGEKSAFFFHPTRTQTVVKLPKTVVNTVVKTVTQSKTGTQSSKNRGKNRDTNRHTTILTNTVVKTVVKTVTRSAGGPLQNFSLSAGAVR